MKHTENLMRIKVLRNALAQLDESKDYLVSSYGLFSLCAKTSLEKQAGAQFSTAF